MKVIISKITILVLVTTMTNYGVMAFTSISAPSVRHFHPPPSPIALSMIGDISYGMRKAVFGIKDKDDLKSISKQKNAILVDVRNPDEIAEENISHPFVEGRCLLENDCNMDEVQLLLPDSDAPHIVFCAKGGRAMKACQTLKELGYSKVYNAGGLRDIDFLS